MNPPNFKDAIAASPYVMTIGVAGDSGSGKTTFTNGIRKIFGDDLVSTITLDDYHSLDREGRQRKGITALNPRANRIDLLEKHLAQLKQGMPIEKPVYNHTTGTFDPPVIFRPNRILILEGLHTFSTSTLRKYLDFTLFVNPDRDVKYDWKIRRDVQSRGYSREEVMAKIRVREPDYAQYVEPQIPYADAVISIGYSAFGRELGEERNVYRITLSQKKLRHAIEDIDLSLDLYSILSHAERNFALQFLSSNGNLGTMGDLVIDGELNESVVEQLEHSIERQTRLHPIAIFRNCDCVTAGELAQLILCWRIIHRRIFMETAPDT